LNMKQLALLGAAVFGVIGGYIPVLFGVDDILSGWSILGGMVGGFFGIWAGVKLYRALN
jgi:hypothetical protein